ncbi:MAG: GNAT family N-acetyltransferase [Ktedonobacterales bacterium]
MDLVNAETPLATERLLLQPLTPAHAAMLFPPLRDQRLYAYIPQDPPPTLAVLEQRFTRLARRRSPDGSEIWLNWALRLTSESLTSESLYVGTLQATLRADETALLAYMIFTPFQGRGYAHEGCARVLNHLVRDYAVRRVIAEIDTRNQPSIALVQSLGFTRVATAWATDFFKGAASDEYRYEYRPAPS